MNSILNMILALKLKLILIILSVGGIYLLENRSHKQGVEKPEPPGVFQTAWNIEAMPVYQEQKTGTPVKEIPLIVNTQPPEPAPSYSNPCKLSDLGLHIEL